MQDWLGLTRIQNDALGRATKVTYPDQKEVAYTYGKAGERRSITYPDGRTVYYGSDEQLRLSELKEGDRIITYGYDAYGRLSEKQFPNGTGSTYHYDRKDQLTELVHRDKEGILDRYTYLYDLLGNKTGITKERRGLEHESGHYRYGYDALGRLSEIQKDGKLQTRYHYDAFGNRTGKEAGGGETVAYTYNALNQLTSLIEQRADTVSREIYRYDKRGNLTETRRNGGLPHRYVYGALNRLEEAVSAAGQTAKYQYNGLGHRTGKSIGSLPAEQAERLEPESRMEAEIGNLTQIQYTIDLTRQYHNLLEKVEDDTTQTYFWDGNVAAYEEGGKRSYYLQDELGSPLRIEDELGLTRETYGYGAFGEDLYGNQGVLQAFGYTGYQRDNVAGTYYAQAREYLAENGRFAGQDLIAGFMDMPFSMNRYSYCFHAPMILVDLDGAWPEWVEDIGECIKDTANKAVDWAKNNKENLIKIGIGIGVAAIGVGITVATGGSALPAVIAAGKAIAISGTVSAVVSGGITATKMTINGEIQQRDAWSEVGKSMWDGFGEGVMWGGIMAGGSQIVSGALKQAAKMGLKTGKKGGINLFKNIKIFSPDSLRYDNAGGTLIKIGESFRIDVKVGPEVFRLLHMHIITKHHIPIGLMLSSLLPGLKHGLRKEEAKMCDQ